MHLEDRAGQDGRDLHPNLTSFAVPDDAEINNLAGLNVAQSILKVEEIGDARSVHPDYHVVSIADMHLVEDRHE